MSPLQNQIARLFAPWARVHPKVLKALTDKALELSSYFICNPCAAGHRLTPDTIVMCYFSHLCFVKEFHRDRIPARSTGPILMCLSLWKAVEARNLQIQHSSGNSNSVHFAHEHLLKGCLWPFLPKVTAAEHEKNNLEQSSVHGPLTCHHIRSWSGWLWRGCFYPQRP